MEEKRFLLKRRVDDRVVCDLDGLPIVFESDKQVLEEPALMKFLRKAGICIRVKTDLVFMTAVMTFIIGFQNQIKKMQR